MKKSFATLVDRYALAKFHLKRSKEDQFYLNIDEIKHITSNSESYFKPTAISKVELINQKKDKNYINGTLRFENEIESEDGSKYFSVDYRKNDKVKDNHSVILIHGWRSRDFKSLDSMLLNKLKREGLDVYYYTLPFHMNRTPEASLYSGEFMVSANVNRTIKAFAQAVGEVRALISYIKNNSGGKVFLVGMSLGGFVGNLTAVKEENIDGLVSIFYANDLSFTIFETIPGKYIKEDFLKNGLTKDQLSEYWQIINPSLHEPLISRDRIVLLTANYDQYIFYKDAEVLWNNWGRPTRRKLYDCGHSGIILSRRSLGKEVTNQIKNIVRGDRGV